MAQSLLIFYYTLILKMNNRIFKELSQDLGLNESDIRDVYKFTFEFIKNTIESLPLMSELTEDEFKKMKTTFILPELGKLGCDYKTYKNIRSWYLKKSEER